MSVSLTFEYLERQVEQLPPYQLLLPVAHISELQNSSAFGFSPDYYQNLRRNSARVPVKSFADLINEKFMTPLILLLQIAWLRSSD